MSSQNALQLMKMPFTHGIEMEIQIVNLKGVWIDGEKMVSIMGKIVEDAETNLKNILKKQSDPVTAFVNKKISNIRVEQIKKRGDTLVCTYKLPDGKQIDVEILGRDPHIGTITWILEVATPPCDTFEELTWWAHTLVKLSHDALPPGVKVVTTGLNPLMDFQQGLSFGDHHHIGVPDSNLRIYVYNLLRAFLPHLIALSVNSPFVEGKPTDIVEIKEGRLQAPRCVRSVRLEKNIKQLGPDDAQHYIPYLEGYDEKKFESIVGRVPARMCDMFPFTNFGTVEVRVFDSQISVIRRIALAVLIQALALKAKKMFQKGEKIPDIDSDSLVKNRRSAIRWGLTGPFFKQKELDGFMKKHPEFSKFYYLEEPHDGQEPLKRMLDAVKNMLLFLKEEFEEMGVLRTEYLKPVLLTVYGDLGGGFSPPLTTADYQLLKFVELSEDMERLTRELQIIADQSCANVWSDPVLGTPNLQEIAPATASMDIKIEPEVVFEGQPVICKIFLENKGKKPLENILIASAIYDSLGEEKLGETFKVERLEPAEKRVGEFEFNTEIGITQYMMKTELKVGNEIMSIERNTIQAYHVACTSNLIAQVDGVIVTGATEVPYAVFVENATPLDMNLTLRVSILDTDQNEELYSISNGEQPWGKKLRPLHAKGQELFVAMSEEMAKLQWAKDALEAQQEGSWNEIPPLVLHPRMAKSSFLSPQCSIMAQVLDQNGKVISENRSPTFRVFFQTPEVALEMMKEPSKTYHIGEPFEISFSVDATRISSTDSLDVIVKLKSASTQNFELVLKEETIDPTKVSVITTNWKTTEDALKNLRSDIMKIAVELYQGGSLLEHEEFPHRFRLVKGPPIEIEWMDVPKRVFVNMPVSGKLRVGKLKEVEKPLVLNVEAIINDQNQLILTKSIDDFPSEAIIDVKPLNIPQATEHFCFKATLIKNGKPILESIHEVPVINLGRAVEVTFQNMPDYFTPGSAYDLMIQVANRIDDKIAFDLNFEGEIEGERVFREDVPIHLKPRETLLAQIGVKIPAHIVDKECVINLVLSQDGIVGWVNKKRLKIELDKPKFRVGYSSKPPLAEYVMFQGETMKFSITPIVQSFADYDINARIVFGIFEKNTKDALMQKKMDTILTKGKPVRPLDQPIIWEIKKSNDLRTYYLGTMIFDLENPEQPKEIPNKLVLNSLVEVTIVPEA
ncbi:MAG: carboxylate-amine ligase [Candidatus Jordarchaeum sp.]|uniref:carboxylate-amine ligase n=1 Tax=Candidatus Jordarchaeum sp. TaxID=2823881 RepID=UPI0040499DF8